MEELRRKRKTSKGMYRGLISTAMYVLQYEYSRLKESSVLNLRSWPMRYLTT
jgi:hypothetical protein